MNNIPFQCTDEFLTVVINAKPHTMSSSSPNFQKAIDALKIGDEEALLELFDQKSALQNYADGKIEIKDNKLFHEGEELHGHVVDRIFNHMEKGIDFTPLLRFIEKLQNNPSRRAVSELYSFLEHKNMPVTDSGNFVAYKGVTSDYKDYYSGKFDNSVGQTLSMRRNSVCDDANIGCSEGFHAGSYDYAKGYACNGGHLMLVEINPEDVVSVPLDCDQQKLRTSKYTVVAHCEKILKEEVYDYDYDEEIDEDDLEYLNEQDVNENSAGDIKSLLSGFKKYLEERKNNSNN